MITYKSKIGAELIIPLSILFAALFLFMIYEKAWLATIFTFVVVCFIVHVLTSTYYQVDNIDLKIKCSFLYNKSIEINSIKEIKPSKNPISSPAASLDRLEIGFNKFDRVLISPKEKDKFIAHLRTSNPNIKLISKNV